MEQLNIRVCEKLLDELNKMTLVHLYSKGFRSSDLMDFGLDLTKDCNLIYQTSNRRIKKELDYFFKERFNINFIIKFWYKELLIDNKIVKFLKLREDEGIWEIIDLHNDNIEKSVDEFGNKTYKSIKDDIIYKDCEIFYIDMQEELSLID